MQDETFQKILYVAGAIIVLCVGALLWHSRASNGSSQEQATGGTASTTSTALPGGGTIVTGGGNATIGGSSVNSAASSPDYTKPLTFPSSMTSDVVSALTAQFAQDQKTIGASHTDFDAWVNLGELRKMTGDYAGAAADWEYMSALYPKNAATYASLGDLYTNYLDDYAKAASNYQKAILESPNETSLYADLFSLYTNQYPEGSSDPSAVLKQGIATNQNAPDLQVLLARWYRGKGDKTDAKAEYDAAIQLYQGQGNTAAVSELQEEEAGL